MKQTKQKPQEITKYLSLLFRMGFKMIVSILLFFGIGLWAENQLHLKGAGILLGVSIGIASGFYLLYKDIFLSIPILATIVTALCQGFGFYTLLSMTPTYLNNIQHFSLQSVSC